MRRLEYASRLVNRQADAKGEECCDGDWRSGGRQTDMIFINIKVI